MHSYMSGCKSAITINIRIATTNYKKQFNDVMDWMVMTSM